MNTTVSNSDITEVQLSKEEAIKFYDDGIWKDWDAEQIVKFQLFQRRLCIPFDVFHKSMEDVLCRPVYTHEFVFKDNLVNEYFGLKKAPCIDEIINLIPSEKIVLVVTP